MIRSVKWIICLIVWSQTFASFEISCVDIQAMGRGQTSHGFECNPNYVFLNPSLLSNIHPVATVALLQPYGMKALQTCSASSAWIFNKFGIGMGWIQLGNRNYRESTFSAGAGFKLSDKLAIGFCGQCYQLFIRNYGDAVSLALNFGTALNLTQDMKVLFTNTNCFQNAIGRSKEPLPQTMTLGVNYRIMENTVIAFEWFRDVRFPTEIRGGLDLTVYHSFKLRGGFTQNPNTFSAGFGWSWHNFTWDYAMHQHSILGMTHGFSFSITSD